MNQQHFGPFDLVARQALAALWHEAEDIVHGGADCIYERCPHSIDMCDLLVAVTRTMPTLYEETGPPEMAN